MTAQPEQDREQDQPDQEGVEQHRDAEDDAHFLGWERIGEREGEEHGDHDRRSGEDDASGVREAVDLVRVPFRTAEVELRVSQGEAVSVRGSMNHLLQVLINILLNAKDASSSGSLVELAWNSSGSEAVIAIVDHGRILAIGTPAEMRASRHPLLQQFLAADFKPV